MTLKQFREKYNIQYKVLSDLTGIHVVSIQDYARGNKIPSKKQLRRIEEAINSLGKELSKVHLISEEWL